MWISPAFHLKVIRTFDAVTAGALDPAVSQVPEPTPSLMPELQIAQTAAAMLRLSEPSKIRMLAEICRLRGVASSFLPDYVDEPLVRSLSSLLKEHGSRLSAQTANQALVELGLLETLARPGSKGATKRFRSLTDAGLAYGSNETAPQNPRETQPLYYVHRFAELLARLERHLGQGRDASQPAAAKRRVVH